MKERIFTLIAIGVDGDVADVITGDINEMAKYASKDSFDYFLGYPKSITISVDGVHTTFVKPDQMKMVLINKRVIDKLHLTDSEEVIIKNIIDSFHYNSMLDIARSKLVECMRDTFNIDYVKNNDQFTMDDYVVFKSACTDAISDYLNLHIKPDED